MKKCHTSAAVHDNNFPCPNCNKYKMMAFPALFYSSVKCTGAPKYPYKNILVHRCTSPMNRTMHPFTVLSPSAKVNTKAKVWTSCKILSYWVRFCSFVWRTISSDSALWDIHMYGGLHITQWSKIGQPENLLTTFIKLSVFVVDTKADIMRKFCGVWQWDIEWGEKFLTPISLPWGSGSAKILLHDRGLQAPRWKKISGSII